MSNFQFGVPKFFGSQNKELSEAVEPLYSAMGSIYNNFLYACGVITPPITSFHGLATSPGLETCQPQNLNRFYCTAGEDLAAGKLVYTYLDGETLKVAKAIGGTSGHKAIGYVNYGGSSGDIVELIIGFGFIPVSGAAVGTEYYLSDSSAGSFSPTAPGSGVIQVVGTCVAPDTIYVHCF